MECTSLSLEELHCLYDATAFAPLAVDIHRIPRTTPYAQQHEIAFRRVVRIKQSPDYICIVYKGASS